MILFGGNQERKTNIQPMKLAVLIKITRGF